MSNSALATVTLISPNRTHPRAHAIDTVTVHCFVGQVTARRGCEIFQPTTMRASCNYVVGCDGSIGLCVEEGDRSWCSGGSWTVNGISGRDNDHRAITIEVASATKAPYEITDKAMDALIALLTDICRRNSGIGRLRWEGDKTLVGKPERQNMTVHRWFEPKACPGDYIYARLGQIASAVNEKLDASAQPWYRQAQEWAVRCGIADGKRPDDACTRAEVWTMLKRLSEQSAAEKGQ